MPEVRRTTGTTRSAPTVAGRAALPLVVFLVCFGLGVGFAGRYDRWSDLVGVGDSLKHLEAHGASYDVLFVGSSHFLRGVDIHHFDKAMASRGAPVKSFSLSHQALFGYELDAVLRETFEQTQTRPRWVVIGFASPNAGLANAGSPRTVFWHTWDAGLSATRDALTDPGLALPTRVEWAWAHLRHIGQNVLGVGRGVLILRRMTAANDAAEQASVRLARTRGFLPYWERKKPALFADRYDHFQRETADLGERNAVWAPPRLVHREHFRRQVEMIRAYGAEPIYVLMPTDDRSSAPQRTLHQLGVVPTLLIFDDPERYPEFYGRELHRDLQHLNRRGARVLADHLARQIAPLDRDLRAGEARR